MEFTRNVNVEESEEIVISYLDLDAVTADEYYKEELHFDKENSKKLVDCLKQRYDGTLTGILEKNFYESNHLDEWFRIEEFEEFCDEHSIIREKVKVYGYYYRSLQL